MLISNIYLIGVISLFVTYWPMLATMDAVSATIVAGGRARIRLTGIPLLAHICAIFINELCAWLLSASSPNVVVIDTTLDQESIVGGWQRASC